MDPMGDDIMSLIVRLLLLANESLTSCQAVAVAGGNVESQTFVKQRLPSSEPIYRICPCSMGNPPSKAILQPAMLSYKSVTNRNILMIFVAQNEEFFPRGWSVRLEVYICLTHFKHEEALEYVLNSRDCFTLLKMIFLFPQGGDLLVSWRVLLLNVHSGNLT